jgi:hypothetical protein
MLEFRSYIDTAFDTTLYRAVYGIYQQLWTSKLLGAFELSPQVREGRASQTLRESLNRARQVGEALNKQELEVLFESGREHILG